MKSDAGMQRVKMNVRIRLMWFPGSWNFRNTLYDLRPKMRVLRDGAMRRPFEPAALVWQGNGIRGRGVSSPVTRVQPSPSLREERRFRIFIARLAFIQAII